jgi:hypothetical protein
VVSTKPATTHFMIYKTWQLWQAWHMSQVWHPWHMSQWLWHHKCVKCQKSVNREIKGVGLGFFFTVVAQWHCVTLCDTDSLDLLMMPNGTVKAPSCFCSKWEPGYPGLHYNLWLLAWLDNTLHNSWLAVNVNYVGGQKKSRLDRKWMEEEEHEESN